MANDYKSYDNAGNPVTNTHGNPFDPNFPREKIIDWRGSRYDGIIYDQGRNIIRKQQEAFASTGWAKQQSQGFESVIAVFAILLIGYLIYLLFGWFLAILREIRDTWLSLTSSDKWSILAGLSWIAGFMAIMLFSSTANFIYPLLAIFAIAIEAIIIQKKVERI